MCGRYNITSAPLTALLMELVGSGFSGAEQLNVAPTETVPVLRAAEDSGSGPDAGDGAAVLAGSALVPMRWWLTPAWAKEQSTRYAMFNARAENLAKSPAFRGPFARRRCLVPLSGFYEWQREDGVKQPLYVQRADAVGLATAGIWDRWQPPDGGPALESFAMVTTAVHPHLAFLHHRQPVLLDRQRAALWLDPAATPDALAAVLEPALPHALEVTPVSTRVNNARHKGPEVLQPTGNPRLVPAG